jgi:hypothetical protein
MDEGKKYRKLERYDSSWRKEKTSLNPAIR